MCNVRVCVPGACVKVFIALRVIVRTWDLPLVLVPNCAISKYEFDKVVVAGEVPRLVAEIVNVLIGIGVLVDDPLSEVISPAMYNL